MVVMRLGVARSAKTRTLKIRCKQKEKSLEMDPRTTVITDIIPGYE